MARGDRSVSDPRALRALAHPARLAILEHLNAEGSATATQCAGPAEVSPAAASYHLRLLERYGFVEDAGGAGDGRERPWRAVGTGFRFEEEGPAGRSLLEQLIARGDRWTAAYVDGATRLPRAWRAASHIGNKTLRMSAAEAASFVERFEALCDEFRRGRDDAPDDAEDVKLFVRFFPSRVRRR